MYVGNTHWVCLHKLSGFIYVKCLFSISVQHHCFQGTQSSCIFTCHCRDNQPCDHINGSCPTGCDQTGVVPWKGESCQVGNVALSKNILSENYDISRCVDGDIETLCFQVTSNDSLTLMFKRSFIVRSITVYAYNIAKQMILTPQDEHLDEVDCEKYVSVPSPYEVICSNSRVKNIIISTNDETSVLDVQEIVIEGYEYYQCKSNEEGESYYGPSCSQSCGCSIQCNYISGKCHGDCIDGFKKMDGICRRCDGKWGPNCENTCNCRTTNAKCDPKTGSCSSGCKEGYGTISCNYKLPDLNLYNLVIVKSTGKLVRLHLEKSVSEMERNYTNLEFGVKYRLGSKFQIDKEILFNDVIGLNNTITYQLPLYKRWYQLCVVPFDTDVREYGICSKYSSIYTDCLDGFYGDVCQYKCTCKNKEICDTNTGECKECDEERSGLDCKTITTHSTFIVEYETKENTIQTNFQLSEYWRNEITGANVTIECESVEDSPTISRVNLDEIKSNRFSKQITNVAPKSNYLCHVYVENDVKTLPVQVSTSTVLWTINMYILIATAFSGFFLIVFAVIIICLRCKRHPRKDATVGDTGNDSETNIDPSLQYMNSFQTTNDSSTDEYTYASIYT